MKTAKIILGTALVLIALACGVVMLTEEVPKETIREITTTATETVSTTESTTTTTTTEKPTENRTEPKSTETTTTETAKSVYLNDDYVSPEYFRIHGIISDGRWNYTWYSERVLPGKKLDIPGRHSDGNYVRDEDEYIVLASSELPKGTIVDTPFGAGKVYDDGCGAGIIDVYVSW